jgi:hypothetical protein
MQPCIQSNSPPAEDATESGSLEAATGQDEANEHRGKEDAAEMWALMGDFWKSLGLRGRLRRFATLRAPARHLVMGLRR